jgi:hypothetical protein
MSMSRRELLGGAATVGLLGVGSEARAATGPVIARLSELIAGAPVRFGYPDDSSPAWLLKLGRATPGGVGPDA